MSELMKIHLQLQVEDHLSEVESVLAVFQSPSGQSTIDLQLEKDQDVSRPNFTLKGLQSPLLIMKVASGRLKPLR